jgi:hypothetical protein
MTLPGPRWLGHSASAVIEHQDSEQQDEPAKTEDPEIGERGNIGGCARGVGDDQVTLGRRRRHAVAS